MSGGMQGGGGVPDDLLTTKGDTHGYSTENARVPIGADTQVLTADSTQALGLAWQAPVAGYLQPTLGNTAIPSNTTVSTIDGLTLTDAIAPPMKLLNQGIAGLGALSFQPTAVNSVGHIMAIPSGTNTRSQITFARQNNPSVNADLLTMGSDIYSTSEHQIRTYSSGTGTTRPLIFMYDTTKVMELSSASGITVNGKITAETIMQKRESQTLDSSGDWVYTRRNVLLDTFGGAATDDANGTTIAVGQCDEVMIQTEVSTRDVTIKDAVAASGTNFQGAGDFTLDLDSDVWYGIANLGVTSFAEISRSNNS